MEIRRRFPARPYPLLLPALLALAAAAALGCSFAFMEDADLGEPEAEGKVVETAFDGGVRYAYYDSKNVLLKYEDSFVADGKETQRQRHAPDGAFLHAWLYAYGGDGNKTMEAFYGANAALASFSVHAWTGGKVETTAEFDAAGVVLLSRRFSYGVDGAPAGELRASVSFGQDGKAAAGLRRDYYSAEGTPLVVLETSFGTKPSCCRAILPAGDSASAGPAPAARTTRDSRAEGTLSPAVDKKSLALPADPGYAVPALPSDAELAALGASGYRLLQEDPPAAKHGRTEAVFDKDWYPAKVTRWDDRLPQGRESASVALSWQAGRLVRKTSYFGSTLALDLRIGYTAEGYPASVAASGAAMLLPLELSFKYEGSRPTQVAISSKGAPLQRFDYEYSGPTSLPASVAALRETDPFAALEALDAARLTIRHYDGGGALIESFAFSKAASGIRVDVANASGANAGRYEAIYDADGRKASLAAYGASGGEPLWSYAYGYDDALAHFKDLDANLKAQLDSSGFGRVAESYLTADVGAYAKAFLIDLLF